MKAFCQFLLFMGAALTVTVGLAAEKANHFPHGNIKANNPPYDYSNSDTQMLMRQHNLEQEGRLLEKQNKFEEAIAKYRQAVDIDRELYDSDQGRPLAFIIEVYQKQGKFEEALKQLHYLKERHKGHQHYDDWQHELESLIQAKKSKTGISIYERIHYLKEKYKKELPPKRYWFGSTQYTDAIIRLYDHIGDSDEGIAFVDQILAYKKLRPKARSEYLKVREAFAQDKKEGFKGCLDAKPGTVCMGRATQALIQSDYFPW